MGTYLLFARAWIQWQSEQALYCVAESQPASACHRRLLEKLHEFLPWGELSANVRGASTWWQVEVQWHFHDYAFRTSKELTPQGIAHNRDLRW